MTTAARIMKVLEEGPATTGEVALEIGTSASSASARLHSLMNQGRVARSPMAKAERGIGRRVTSLWRPANQGSRNEP